MLQSRNPACHAQSRRCELDCLERRITHLNTDSFPFAHNLEVIFRDVDSMGHVNNAVYFTYLETARIKYFRELTSRPDLEHMNMIVARATCDYKAPAFLGEHLNVGVAVTRFGTKSFDFTYHIVAGDGRLIAIAKTVQVAYDYQADRPMALPAAFKAAVLDYQGGLEFPSAPDSCT